jgi:hypothetical protein
MRHEAGEALVEALIGSAIVALTLGAMFHSVVDSAARNRMAEEKRFATLIAQSELATVGPLVPVAPGVTTGRSSRWQTHCHPATLEPFGA